MSLNWCSAEISGSYPLILLMNENNHSTDPLCFPSHARRVQLYYLVLYSAWDDNSKQFRLQYIPRPTRTPSVAVGIFIFVKINQSNGKPVTCNVLGEKTHYALSQVAKVNGEHKKNVWEIM